MVFLCNFRSIFINVYKIISHSKNLRWNTRSILTVALGFMLQFSAFFYTYYNNWMQNIKTRLYYYILREIKKRFSGVSMWSLIGETELLLFAHVYIDRRRRHRHRKKLRVIYPSQCKPIIRIHRPSLIECHPFACAHS